VGQPGLLGGEVREGGLAAVQILHENAHICWTASGKPNSKIPPVIAGTAGV